MVVGVAVVGVVIVGVIEMLIVLVEVEADGVVSNTAAVVGGVALDANPSTTTESMAVAAAFGE